MTLSLSMPDGSALGLHVSRFDERQRRLRLRLPKAASCWDFAPLVDVVRREPGFDAHRFTGKTAAQPKRRAMWWPLSWRSFESTTSEH